ncbi:hypothetical protein Tco_0815963 [Tanacetum coccineum]
MINLPAGDTTIGIYSRIFDSSGVRIHFSSFLLAVLEYFKVHISQLVPLDKVPTNFNQDHVDQLKAHIVKLYDIPEGVLVQSGLSRVWRNPMFMSIHDFLYMPSLDKATVREEPHGLDTSILGTVADRTTSPAPAAKKTKLSQKVSGAGSNGLAAGDVLERDLLPFVLGPYYIPYPYDEGSRSESPPYTRDD